MSKELDGTFVVDFQKRELFLALFAGLQYLNETGSYAELGEVFRTNENELDALREKLTEYFSE